MRGRIRYQKPGQLWPPWLYRRKPMERKEACEWFAEHLEEFLPKLEEARKRFYELEDKIEIATEEKWRACAKTLKTHECQEARSKLIHLRDEYEKASHDIGKYQSWCINIELRMKELKCEEIL